jgi:hypothetical protein
MAQQPAEGERIQQPFGAPGHELRKLPYRRQSRC